MRNNQKLTIVLLQHRNALQYLWRSNVWWLERSHTKHSEKSAPNISRQNEQSAPTFPAKMKDQAHFAFYLPIMERENRLSLIDLNRSRRSNDKLSQCSELVLSSQ